MIKKSIRSSIIIEIVVLIKVRELQIFTSKDTIKAIEIIRFFKRKEFKRIKDLKKRTLIKVKDLSALAILDSKRTNITISKITVVLTITQ